MITFQKVKWQNFLAAGNAPIEMVLNAHQNTLVTGKNGHGKSTLNEAICYALYGRPLRNVPKQKLINAINDRDCLVELDLLVGATPYRIKRGMKPNLFEIYENGNLIPSPAAVLDYQNLLETTVLGGMSYKVFQQVVILGTASYVPFMRLTNGARREIIESILDIEVFSAMNALTKDDTTALKTEIEKASQSRDSLSEQLRMVRTFTEHLEEQRLQQLETIAQAITSVESVITSLEAEYHQLTANLLPYAQAKTVYAAASQKRSEYEKVLGSITTQEKKAKKERTFYSTHDTCPTCEQGISDEFKHSRYEGITKIETDASKALVQCRALIDKYTQQETAARQDLDQAGILQRRIDAILVKLPVHRDRLKELNAEHLRKSQPTVTTTPAVDADELQRQLDEVVATLDGLSRQRVIVDAATMLLKDNGIKTKVIRHYIPIINKTVNAYLAAMDFPILFELDAEFNETIRSRHRDMFLYELFSEGEKKRIDLALLLTWRAIAKLKNSASCNLLILDEILDSSLDTNGVEELTKILAGLEKDTNIVIISHKSDQMQDKFAHCVVFEKVKGFSQLVP